MTPPAERAGDINLSEAESAVAFLPVKRVLLECEWFRLYDVIEDVFEELEFYETELAPEDEEPRTPYLRRDLNAYFEYAGIGWKLVENRIVSRGSESFESVAGAAVEALEDSGRPTALAHIRDALQALSPRPNVNAPGAIYHAMDALEAVAREMVGNKKPTLGKILDRYPKLLPAPLNTVFSQIWGYASDTARHVTEGHNPSNEEAELVVGLAASAVTYLIKKGLLQRPTP